MISLLQQLKAKIQSILPDWNVSVGAGLKDANRKTIIISDAYSIDIISDTGFSISILVMGYGRDRNDVEQALILLIQNLHKKVIDSNMLYVKSAVLEANNEFWGFSINTNFFVIFR